MPAYLTFFPRGPCDLQRSWTNELNNIQARCEPRLCLEASEPQRWDCGAKTQSWAQTQRWGAAWRPSIIYTSRGGRTSTDLYPLPDGVIRGRPAVLRVVETGALGRPAGVVLGGCGDLLRGDLPWLHAQRLHAGKICREQKNSIKAWNHIKFAAQKEAWFNLVNVGIWRLLWCRWDLQQSFASLIITHSSTLDIHSNLPSRCWDLSLNNCISCTNTEANQTSATKRIQVWESSHGLIKETVKRFSGLRSGHRETPLPHSCVCQLAVIL